MSLIIYIILETCIENYLCDLCPKSIMINNSMVAHHLQAKFASKYNKLKMETHEVKQREIWYFW